LWVYIHYLTFVKQMTAKKKTVKEKGLSDAELVKKYGNDKKVNLDKLLKKGGQRVQGGKPAQLGGRPVPPNKLPKP